MYTDTMKDAVLQWHLLSTTALAPIVPPRKRHQRVKRVDGPLLSLNKQTLQFSSLAFNIMQQQKAKSKLPMALLNMTPLAAFA